MESVPPHSPTPAARAAVSILRSVDLLLDYAKVTSALRDAFRSLQSGGHTAAGATFLRAIDNGFGIIARPEPLSASRRAFARAEARLVDVHRLPTTMGIVIMPSGRSLLAWDVAVDGACVASIALHDLVGYLAHGVPPTMTFDRIAQRGSSSGTSMRDLAGIAAALRQKELHGLIPIHFEGGMSRLGLSDRHLQRLGIPAAHRVRAHLRTNPVSGRISEVREHHRYGLGDVPATAVRLRVL